MTYLDFKTMCNAKQIWRFVQYEEYYILDEKHYTLEAWDGPKRYCIEIETQEGIIDFETNYKNLCNQPIQLMSSYGTPVMSPSFDDVQGLYPKKKCYKDTVNGGQINIFDIEVTQEKRIHGGEYWIHQDDVSKVHDDDFIEFSVVDKNDVLGLFGTYGLNKENGDILELCKFILTDYVKKGNASDGYHSVLYEGIKGTNLVTKGLFLRTMYDSHGSENIRWMWRLYYYE